MGPSAGDWFGSTRWDAKTKSEIEDPYNVMNSKCYSRVLIPPVMPHLNFCLCFTYKDDEVEAPHLSP